MDRQPRILLVDDDSAVIDTYLRVLERYAPLRASNGVEAQKILSGTTVDVVLCDLEMPLMNGLDLMHWAKENCPHPLWIVVTGAGTFDAATRALKLGAFDFVSKPIASPLQLKTVVANAVRHQKLTAELADSRRNLETTNATLLEQRAMLDQDLLRAARLLRALLPSALRPLEKLHVDVGYRPSTSIGGDVYGAAMLDHRHLAIYVADAAGHGVSAALLAVLFNQRLVAFNAEPGRRTPATMLSDLNRALMDECRASGLFVTAAYASIDTLERTVTIASAGHPPAIVLDATGASRHLEKTGPALGLVPDAIYGEHRFSLADGDRLLLYTDGLTGALHDRAPKLETILSQTDGDVAGEFLQWTDRAKRGDDDITLLLLSATSGVSTFDTEQPATARTASSDCPLSVGSSKDTTWVAIRGDAKWKDAAVLRETCMDALDGGRSVVVDLAGCTMLDSTILGTLHELVVRAEPRASLRLQSADESIRGLFEELAMTQVLAALAPNPRSLPVTMMDLHASGDAAQCLVLHAHELLADLSAKNAAQFQPVIDALQSEAH